MPSWFGSLDRGDRGDRRDQLETTLPVTHANATSCVGAQHASPNATRFASIDRVRVRDLG